MTDPFEILRRQFIARCRVEVEQIRQFAPDDPELGLVVHRLAGSAGSFGHPKLSEAAAALDERIRYGPPPAPNEIRTLTDALEIAIAREP